MGMDPGFGLAGIMDQTPLDPARVQSDLSSSQKSPRKALGWRSLYQDIFGSPLCDRKKSPQSFVYEKHVTQWIWVLAELPCSPANKNIGILHTEKRKCRGEESCPAPVWDTTISEPFFLLFHFQVASWTFTHIFFHQLLLQSLKGKGKKQTETRWPRVMLLSRTRPASLLFLSGSF